MTLPEHLWFTRVLVGMGPNSADCLVAVHDNQTAALAYAGALKKHAGRLAASLGAGARSEVLESHRTALIALVGPDSLPAEAIRKESGQDVHRSRWSNICTVVMGRDYETGRLTLLKGPPPFICVYPFDPLPPPPEGEEAGPA